MKLSLSKIMTAIVALLSLDLSATASDMKLWYDRPASLWVEALPLGNGAIGAMVFGNPANEQFQLNEETVWGGSPYNNTNPKAKESLDEIRRLIFDGENAKAQKLCGPAICSPQGANGMPYQTVGSLMLDFDNVSDYTDFYRDLDISRAVATTRFRVGDTEYIREAFTSIPDRLFVVRLSASKKGKISFTAVIQPHMPTTFCRHPAITNCCFREKPTTMKAYPVKLSLQLLHKLIGKAARPNPSAIQRSALREQMKSSYMCQSAQTLSTITIFRAMH